MKNFYLLYFPNRNGLKDETGNVGSKMCSISVALPREGLRIRVTLFRTEIEWFWLRFAKQSDQHIFYYFLKTSASMIFSNKNWSYRTKISNRIKNNSKYLLFRGYGKGRTFWSLKKAIKISKSKGLFNPGWKDLSVDPGAVPKGKNLPRPWVSLRWGGGQSSSPDSASGLV